MPCRFVQGADGSMTILCGPNRVSRKPCVACGRPATRRCDRVLDTSRHTVLRRDGVVDEVWHTTTCDAAICSRCTQRLGRSQDRCPEHRVTRLAPTRQLTLQLTLDLEG